MQPAPVSRQILDDAQHARREHIGARREDTRQLGPQGTQALPHGDAPLKQERTDLIDDAGTLTDQSIADAVQRLKVELIKNGRSQHSSADSINISEFDFRQAQLRRDLSNCCQMPSRTALASRESTVSKPSVN